MQKVSMTVHRMLQYVIVSLLAIIGYWTKDIYADFKDMRKDIQQLKVQQAVTGSIIEEHTQILSKWQTESQRTQELSLPR